VRVDIANRTYINAQLELDYPVSSLIFDPKSGYLIAAGFNVTNLGGLQWIITEIDVSNIDQLKYTQLHIFDSDGVFVDYVWSEIDYRGGYIFYLLRDEQDLLNLTQQIVTVYITKQLTSFFHSEIISKSIEFSE
jgi:hypothetical protein